MTTADQFLATIFSDLNDDEHICVSRAATKKDGGVWFHNFTPQDRQWRKWEPDVQAAAWYFCVSTVSGESNEKGSMIGRGRQHLRRYHCIVLDDIGTKGAPPPVEPSWKATTSIINGVRNQQWGYLLDPGDDWNTYEAVVDWCAQQGWADAGAGGSYRLMRVPGSTNLKPGRQFAKTTIDEADWSVWSLEEFMEDMGCNLDQLEIKDVQVKTLEGGAQAVDGIDPLLDWLVDAGHVVRDSGGEWVDIVCPWADQHTGGQNTAGYSPLGRGSGVYVQTRAFKCLHEHCLNRKLAQFGEWSTALGAPAVMGYDPLPWLQDKYVYVESGQRFYDMHQRPVGGTWWWEWGDWVKRYPGYLKTPDAPDGQKRKPLLIATAMLEHENTKRAVSTKYHPIENEEDTGVVRQFGQNYVNTYLPPNLPETHAIPEVFIKHVKFLLPDERERTVFLDWLAYKIQHPRSRSYAYCMIAEATFGVGRSWIGEMITKMMPKHVNRATLAQLVGRGTSAEQNYNDWMVGCQFLIVEEARDNTLSREEFYNSYETFKQNVEPRGESRTEIRVNEKYGRTRDEVVYYNALIFTNHADAMLLEEGDRRVYCARNPTHRLTPEYYQTLADALLTDAEPARAYWWLKRREVTVDQIYPEMTPSKQYMIGENRKPSDVMLDWMLDNHPPDLVTRKSLRSLVVRVARELDDDKTMTEPGMATKFIWKKLKSLRASDTKNGARYLLDGKQTEVRSLRNYDFWVRADEERNVEAVKSELDKEQMASNVVNIR